MPAAIAFARVTQLEHQISEEDREDHDVIVDRMQAEVVD